MAKKMTQKKYIETGGAFCPFCESPNIEGGAVEIDLGGAYQPMFCSDCESSWEDKYNLVGYNIKN